MIIYEKSHTVIAVLTATNCDKNLQKEFSDDRSLTSVKKVNLISWDHPNIIMFPLSLDPKEEKHWFDKDNSKDDLASNSADQ